MSERGINAYLSDYIRSMGDLSGKVVVDVPAGGGASSALFAARGATVLPLDLFPESFRAEGLTCRKADMEEALPLADGVADVVLCQEGIEHVCDQLSLMREFNRILKPGGTLLITTPSMSFGRARLSHFLSETYDYRKVPPCELDDIWFAKDNETKMYLGHLFLLTANQLRNLTVIGGFRIVERVRTDFSVFSAVLALAILPQTYLVTQIIRLRSNFRYRHLRREDKERILDEVFSLQVSWTTLTRKHHFWVLRKEHSLAESVKNLKKLARTFA